MIMFPMTPGSRPVSALGPSILKVTQVGLAAVEGEIYTRRSERIASEPERRGGPG